MARGEELEPAAVGHVAGEVSRLSTAARDKARACEVGAGARATENRAHALEDYAHHARGVEASLCCSARSDDVEQESADDHHGHDDQDRQVELEVEACRGPAQSQDAENREGFPAHDRGVVTSGFDAEERLDRVDDDLPAHDQPHDAVADQETDPGPEVKVRLGEVPGVRCDMRSHDDQDHAADAETDAGAQAHHVARTDGEWRKGDRGPEGREPEHRDRENLWNVAQSGVVRDHVERAEREEAEQVDGLHPVHGLDERLDQTLDRTSRNPWKALIFGKLLVLDDQDLSQDHDDDQTNDARGEGEGHHLPEGERVPDHHLSGEEVRHEAQATASASHRRDHDHLASRDHLLRHEERSEKEQRGDSRAFLHDPELEREKGIDPAEQDSHETAEEN